MLKKMAVLAMGALGLVANADVMAQKTEGPWMVRARALNLGMDNSNSTGQAPLAALPADSISVNDKTIPDVDITYFFTRNIAAELLLTVPQKQTVTINALGLGNVGTFKHLPPTLTLQYHFMPDANLRPYVGAGINYTRITGVNLRLGLGLENDSWGGALQAGFDYKLSNNLFLNFDVKKIYISTDVFLNGSKISTLKLDPLGIGVGLGWRF